LPFRVFPLLCFPRALVVPRTERCPRGKVLLRRERIHIDTYLGDDRFGNPHTDPRYRIQQLRLVLKRGKIEGYLIAETCNRFIEEVDVGEYGAEKEAVMGCETACQGFLQFRKFLSEGSLGEIGKDFRIGCAFKKGMEHCLAGDTHDICRYRGEFDVRGFEEFVETVHLPCPLADQGGTVPGEIPEVADFLRRNKTSPEKTMCEESAIHSQSRTSVFLPGTALMWAAFHDKQSESTLKDA